MSKSDDFQDVVVVEIFDNWRFLKGLGRFFALIVAIIAAELIVDSIRFVRMEDALRRFVQETHSQR